MRPFVTAATLLSLLVASFCNLQAQAPQQSPSQPPATTTTTHPTTPAADSTPAAAPTAAAVPPVKTHKSHTLRKLLIIGAVVGTGIALYVVLAHHGIKCGPGLGQPGISNSAAC